MLLIVRWMSNEMLWPLSMPPQLPEKEEDIVIAKLENVENVRYRQKLSRFLWPS